MNFNLQVDGSTFDRADVQLRGVVAVFSLCGALLQAMEDLEVAVRYALLLRDTGSRETGSGEGSSGHQAIDSQRPAAKPIPVFRKVFKAVIPLWDHESPAGPRPCGDVEAPPVAGPKPDQEASELENKLRGSPRESSVGEVDVGRTPETRGAFLMISFYLGVVS